MIFYFSSTGNCEYVSKRIAEKTDDTIQSIRDYYDQKEITYTLKNGENLGFVVPTYYGGFPNIVIEFLDYLKIQFAEDNYVFFVATYGSGTANIGIEAQERIGALGKPLDASFGIKMVDNWNPSFDMTDKAYIEKAEMTAETQIPYVVDQILERKCSIELKKTVPGLMQKAIVKMYNCACQTNNFMVSSTCIGCGLCERQRPCHTIKVENGTPVWTFTLTPPVRTFLKENNFKGKDVAVFCCHDGDKAHTLEDMITGMPGSNCIGRIDFMSVLRHDRESAAHKAEEWVKALVETT